MSEYPINDMETTHEPVPQGSLGLAGYCCALMGTLAVAASLVAFGYGFRGWGILGTVGAVVFFAALGAVILRVRRQPRPHPDRDSIRRRFRREAHLRRGRVQ